jgi:hypothetical protein
MKKDNVLNKSEIEVTNGDAVAKKPLTISLTALVTIVLFSSMLLFVLLLMFIETAKML